MQMRHLHAVSLTPMVMVVYCQVNYMHSMFALCRFGPNCSSLRPAPAYAQALQSVLQSCDQREGSAGHRASTRRVASLYALSPQK